MSGKKIKLTFLMIVVLSMIFSKISIAQTDSKDYKIRTGVNVSHWLSQSMKRGEERSNYIVKADFDTIASAGFDHVRIPVDEVQLWDSVGNMESETFKLLHNSIKWALEANLRVIVDLHIIRSHYFNAESNTLWTDPAEQEKLVNMWMQLSDELIKYPNGMLAYEIMNEAVAQDPEDWNKLINKVITAIRVIEPERIIVVGSNMWQGAETFPDLKIPKDDKNIILSFHFYTPMALTHHKAPWMSIGEYEGEINYPGLIVDTANYANLSDDAVQAMSWANGYFDKAKLEELMQPAIIVAKENNLPLYCGEYGVYPTISDEIRFKWYKDICEIFNENNIAYCHWGYKGDFPIVDKNSVPDRRLTDILTAK